MAKEITDQEDIIDSRDIIERIEELESMDELEDYETDELENLKALTEECEYFTGWKDGLTLIRDGYFDEYAENFAKEIYDIQSDRWPFTHIDWNEAADELKQDYSAVDFGDDTYWINNY